MKKIVLIFTLTFIPIFCYSTILVAADFFVIPAGKRAKRTVLVSPQSTATSSGTALLNALSNITDASITKPYLIYIEPGIYDIGDNYLQMKSYVDIQGSGVDVTKITGNIGTCTGVLIGANNVELSNLTVENTGGGTCSYAILNSSSSPRMTKVNAVASGGDYNIGILNGSSSSPTMTNIIVYVSGGTSSIGIQNSSSSPYMADINVLVSEGDTCRGIDNQSSSPSMNRVDISASDGTDNWGVSNASSSSPIMAYIKISASGGTNNVGVWNYSSSPRIMKDIIISAANGTNDNIGIRNHNSSLKIMNVAVGGSGGASNIGVYNTSDSGSIVKIDHSAISGDTYSVYTLSDCETYIGNTRLEGGMVGGGGDNTCAGVYDENYTFSASVCP